MNYIQKYYEFKEQEKFYQLICNGVPVNCWSKSRFSKQEAEDKAGEEVGKAVKKHGLKNVEYNGCYVNA